MLVKGFSKDVKFVKLSHWIDASVPLCLSRQWSIASLELYILMYEIHKINKFVSLLCFSC